MKSNVIINWKQKLHSLCFRFIHAKQTRKNRIPYTVVIGVERPTRVRLVLGSDAMNRATGMRTRKAELIPCIMTGRLFPQPLK